MNQHANEKHVGIVGAGLMGRMMAYYLTRHDYHVHLFDKDDRGGSSSCGLAAAAMLAPISEADKASSIVVKLGLASIPLWQNIVDELEAPIFFQQAGSLFVSHPQDETELTQFIGKISRDWSNQFQPLDQQGIAELEPALANRFKHGIFLPAEAQLANDEWYIAVAKALDNKCVTWHPQTKVKNIAPHVIRTESKTFDFNWVVDCRGLGAKDAIPALRGVRGERFRLYAPDAQLNRPIRLMHPRYHIYIVPRPNQEFILGASEIESDDMSPVSVRSTLELLSALYSLDAAFGEARIVETVVNCRPALPHNEPRIFHQPGLLQINGLYRNGYLVAPAIAETALQLMGTNNSNRNCSNHFTSTTSYSCLFSDIVSPINDEDFCQ